MTDFASIAKKDCVEKALPQGTVLNATRTIVLQSVINEIKEHGRSSMHKEVCGVLVGSLCWDQSPYLLIDGRIEGKHANHQADSVTFTAETWDSIHEELAAKYPGKKIVGWYHTHPGFGVFLSNMDVFIHENFFNNPWQPAYVFDPQAETEAFFFWHDKNLKPEPVAIQPDALPNVRKASSPNPDKICMTLTEDEETKEKKRNLSKAMWTVLLLLLTILLIISVRLNFLLYRRIQDLNRQPERLQLKIVNLPQNDSSSGAANQPKPTESKSDTSGKPSENPAATDKDKSVSPPSATSQASPSSNKESVKESVTPPSSEEKKAAPPVTTAPNKDSKDNQETPSLGTDKNKTPVPPCAVQSRQPSFILRYGWLPIIIVIVVVFVIKWRPRHRGKA